MVTTPDMSAWRGFPIHPAFALQVLMIADAAGRPVEACMGTAHVDGCRAYALKHGLTIREVLEQSSQSGDDKDREITRLQCAISRAADELASWLIDHTEEAFEEEPEIDGAREILVEAFC